MTERLKTKGREGDVELPVDRPTDRMTWNFKRRIQFLSEGPNFCRTDERQEK